jgi:hypothetical protein
MNVDSMFEEHTPTPPQKRRVNSLRNCARMLAREIQSATPTGPNQTLAIRHVDDALILATKAILENSRTRRSKRGLFTSTWRTREATSSKTASCFAKKRAALTLL